MGNSSGFSETELRKFADSGRVISAAIGTSVQLWARAEAGVILKTWAGRTKVATAEKLGRRGLLRAYREARNLVKAGWYRNKGRTDPGEASINLGIRAGQFGKVYYRTRKRGIHMKGAGFQDVFGAGFSRGKRIDSRDWPTISSMVSNFRAHYEAMVAAAKRSAGLSRQSIVQIADDLGIALETVKGGGTLSSAGIAKARAALASNGQAYRNGYGVVSQTAKEFYLTLVNRYPKIGPLQMDTTLQGVILGRVRYFERNLAEGTFLAASRAAKAYPYLEVLRTAA